MGRRPIAFSRRCSQSGLGPFLTPRTSRPAKIGQAEASSRVEVELDGNGIGEAAFNRLDRVLLQLAEPCGSKIAGDAAHAEAVGPVRRDGDFDHRIVEAERGGGRAADLGLSVELDDAGMLVRQFQLALGQQHAVRTPPP